MRSLPLAARLYLISLWGITGILIGATLLHYSALLENIPLLVLALLLYVFADYFEVEFEVEHDVRFIMTVTDAVMIFLVAVSGPIGALVACLGTGIVGALHRHAWHRNLFNVAQRGITYMAMALVYTLISDPTTLPFYGLRGIMALVAVAGVGHTLNTLLVATIIALAAHRPVFHVYRESYQAIHWVHLITLPLGAVMAVLWKINGWLVLPAVVPLLAAQESFKTVAAWQAEHRRSKALAGRLERLQDTATAMIASLEPLPLLKTVSTRLAALLEASASWVILIDQAHAQLVAASNIPPAFEWDAPAYAAEIQQGLRQFAPADIARLHGANGAQWQALVIIPLALEDRVLGGICLAFEHLIALAEDDRRVLLSFAAQAALAVEHARLFEELSHKQDELVRSSKLAALGTFSAGIAHEFNNLLAGILGYAQLGLGSDELADKNEALEVAVRSCMRGRSITGGLLTFARRGEPQRSLHLIQDAVEDVLVLVERELAKNNIHIERRLQVVPPTICDPGQLAQVVLNLMTNARDAMLEQGGGVITVVLAEQDDQIELIVHDTGSGIPKHLLDQVFQPFMTTKGALGGSVTPGAGLGLAISYGIVQSHNGTIEIDSEVGAGTTVTIRLPIVNNTIVNNGKEIAPTASALLRILVVDDERFVTESVARLLESQGHEVVGASDGTAALRRYCEQPFDLVLTDIVMPGMGGVEFVQRLRAVDPSAQVLIMTGHIAQSQIDELVRDGAIGVVQKPFVADELLAAVAKGIEARALRAA
jgi:two-component system, NtrC family, sensor kinase